MLHTNYQLLARVMEAKNKIGNPLTRVAEHIQSTFDPKSNMRIEYHSFLGIKTSNKAKLN